MICKMIGKMISNMIDKMISSIYRFDNNTYNHVIHCKKLTVNYKIVFN